MCCNGCYLLDKEIDEQAKMQEQFEEQLRQDYFSMLSDNGNGVK